MAIKLNIGKTYDRVDQDFIGQWLTNLGFCYGWMNQVMQCTTTLTFRVVMNVKICNIIYPERGI